MEIERGINPNCSELVIRLGTTDKEAVVESLKEINIEEVLVRNYYGELETKKEQDWDTTDNKPNRITKTKDIPQEALELLKKFYTINNGDELKEIDHILVNTYNISPVSDEIMLSNNDNLPDLDNYASLKMTSIGDGSLEITAHQHCQEQLFPTLRKIQECFGAEVEPNDGGSINDYEAWLNGEEPDYE